MPKEKSTTVNGLSMDVDHWKGKSEKDFLEDNGVKDHFKNDTAKMKESWKLFQESIKTK